MSLPQFVSFGWELSDSRVAAVDPLAAEPWNNDAWNSAEAAFVSLSAVAGLWRELGKRPGKGAKERGPSAEREQAVWNGVASFARNLRRILRRGGLLACRLDEVSPRVKIRFPPVSKCFPAGSSLDNYQALSAVHTTLAECAPVSAAGASAVWTVGDSPWSRYLQCEGGLSPCVALESQGTAVTLGRDEAGRTLAAAESQVVLLPPWKTPDPVREAECLIAGALEARSLRALALPQAMPAHAAADLERLRLEERRLDEQIERLRRQREGVRRALHQREQLGALMQSTDSPQFAAAVAQALAILGMPLRGPESLVLSGSQMLVEPLPSGSDPSPHYVVSGRVRRAKRPASEPLLESPRKLRLVSGASCEANSASSSETVVPASELFQAAMAVLASPEDDVLRHRIRQSLHETAGVYRFESASA